MRENREWYERMFGKEGKRNRAIYLDERGKRRAPVESLQSEMAARQRDIEAVRSQIESGQDVVRRPKSGDEHLEETLARLEAEQEKAYVELAEKSSELSEYPGLPHPEVEGGFYDAIDATETGRERAGNLFVDMATIPDAGPISGAVNYERAFHQGVQDAAKEAGVKLEDAKAYRNFLEDNPGLGAKISKRALGISAAKTAAGEALGNAGSPIFRAFIR